VPCSQELPLLLAPVVAKNLARWNVVSTIGMLRVQLQNEQFIQGTFVFTASENVQSYVEFPNGYNVSFSNTNLNQSILDAINLLLQTYPP
jgi:hypothetical protein